jgi:PAS domain S-box-containing protein
MFVAHVREQSPFLFDDARDRPSLYQDNPAWAALTGSIMGLDVGNDRVEFVWASDFGGRQKAAATTPAVRDYRRHSYHASYHWIQVEAGAKRCDPLGQGEESILDALVYGNPLESVLDDICRLVDASIERGRCSVLLVGPDDGRLRCAAGPNLPAGYGMAINAIPFDPSNEAWRSVAVEQALTAADIFSDPAWCAFREFALSQGISTCWSFPLLADDVVHGILVIHHEEKRRPDDRENDIARRLARLAAVAVSRRPADEPLRRNAERHALAVQGADIGIWDWDIERDTLYWSPFLKSMAGLSPEDEPVPGTTFNNLLHSEDRERVEEVLERHLTDRQPFDTACRLRLPDGDHRWVRIKAQATWNADGEPARLAGCLYDITDQRRAEDKLRAAWDAAETASRAKSLFLAAVCQELQTPLSTILGMEEILKDAVPSLPGAGRQNNNAAIRRSGQHLLELIDSILEMVRLDAEQVEFHEEPVALAVVLDEAIQSVRLSQREPRHRLTLDLPSPLPVLSADRRSLKQVLIDVLNDAVKSTPKNGRVAVKVSKVGEALEISVEDDGSENIHDAAPNVLHPLYRIEDIMARRRQDDTLGLFVSKVLVERHGGTIQVESKPDRGKIVYINLPAERLPGGMVRQVNGPRAWRHIARNVI